MSYQPRLKKEFNERIISSLKEEYSYKNVMMVPKLKKIVLSKGVGGAVADKKLIDHAIDELTTITGQKAIQTISKKDVATFKLRKGVPIGAKVTLRAERMYEFLDRLITSALPRVRDFQGIKSSGFDGRGNYNLGVTEQIIFPEIDIDKVNKISGMDITFVTSAESDKESNYFLTELGLPFKKIYFWLKNQCRPVRSKVQNFVLNMLLKERILKKLEIMKHCKSYQKTLHKLERTIDVN
jgi:large subunit ribosomal protein L5